MNRGDVIWHKFKEPDKMRPVVILTRNGAIPTLNTVTAAPVTTSLRDIQSHVVLTEEDGMKEICTVNLDAIQTISKDKLGSYITHLSEERMMEVFEAIKFAFGFDRT